MLQKLESEVRNHIRVEHQLKLHIENNQSHSDELEAQNAKFLIEIKDLQEKLKNYSRIKPEKKENKDYADKIERLEENLKKKEALIHKLEGDIINLKSFHNDQSFDNDKTVGKKIKPVQDEAIEEIKQRFKEKSVGLQKFQRLVREKSSKSIKERSKRDRKSINDNDIYRNKIEDIKIISKMFGKSHLRTTSENIRPKSVGIRPPSH